MINKKMIVINIRDLENALVQQCGSKEFSDLRNVLFYENYINDCYKSYYFEDDGGSAIINCVNAFLRDTFPGEDTVLVDVSW